MSKAAHVRKFLLLPTDFSLAGGELTPTLKVVLAQVSPSKVEAKSGLEKIVVDQCMQPFMLR